MVHVYNCHPFSSQQIVQVSGARLRMIQSFCLFYICISSFTKLPFLCVSQVEQEPGLVCCGGGALFVVATGGCKVKICMFLKHSCSVSLNYTLVSRTYDTSLNWYPITIKKLILT